MMIDIYNIVNDYAICWEPQMVVVYINFDNIFLVAFGHQKKSWIKFFLFVENEKKRQPRWRSDNTKNQSQYSTILFSFIVVINCDSMNTN